jgi:hypothetical protein
MKKILLTKISLSIGVTIILIAILGLIFTIYAGTPFWESYLYNIEPSVMFFLPCILIGSLSKRIFWINVLYGLIPGILMTMAFYMMEAMESPPSYPPTDISWGTFLMMCGTISILSIIPTSIGYGIKKIVERQKNK